MHKVEALEKKWYRYKLKVIGYPMMAIVATATLGSGGTYMYESYKHKQHTTKPSSQLPPKVLAVSKTQESLKPILPVKMVKEEQERPNKSEQKVENLYLEPIIPMVDMEKEERMKEVHKVTKATSKHSTSTLVKAKPNTYLTAKELAVISKVESAKEVIAPHVTKKMKFQSSTMNYYEMMTEKFAKSKKPREALLLAKAYYKDGKYKESQKWALKANKLNSANEESWFLFAKSKAKLGKKREALKILVSYYNKSHSSKAKIVMEQIKSGKI